jgi:hypothetical protein
MNAPMDQPPRHFHANERFFIEIAFEEPLPEGAIPLAEFAGPLGPGGPALTFWTFSAGPAEGAAGDRRRVRLTGKVPADAPPGMYRVTHLEVRWAPEMPLSWEPVAVPLKHLGGDVLVSIDEALARSQPSIPRVLYAG